MKRTRSEWRDLIVKILYQIILYRDNKMNYEINEIILEHTDIQNEFMDSSINGVINHRDELTIKINKYLNNWTLDRLGKMDQAILLFSVYELLFTETPHIVVIDEAIELAKKYSDDDVRKMINGVLDKIYHEEVDRE